MKPVSIQPPRISVTSLEWIRVRVQAKDNGLTVDPTADTVTMAFKTSGDPSGGDFKTASWETDANTLPDTYYARCLVGPGGAATLTAGTYRVWVKIIDTPETPILRCGQMVVF
jgi:hypothetical protein